MRPGTVEAQRVYRPDERGVEFAVEMRKELASPRLFPAQGLPEVARAHAKQDESSLASSMLSSAFDDLLGRRKVQEAITTVFCRACVCRFGERSIPLRLAREVVDDHVFAPRARIFRCHLVPVLHASSLHALHNAGKSAKPKRRPGHPEVVDTDCIDALTLALAFGPTSGLRPHAKQSLLSPDRSAQDWLSLDAKQLTELGVPPKQRARLLDPGTRECARDEWRLAQKLGLTLLWRGHREWPCSLEAIPDPPFALWARGQTACLEENGVAVVGPRAASPYGLHAARSYARAIGLAGLPVVSGLARGVDAAAHRATLETPSPTIAVLGSGLASIYPAEHEELAREIAERGGLLLSEAPPQLGALPMLFPRRNRLLVALSRAVLVVEATIRSGALLTAEWALCYDRPIWAIPGPYSSPQSVGCHRLIRDGAYLSDSPESFIEDLGLTKRESDARGRIRSADQVAVLEALARQPQPLDALASELTCDRARILVALRELEILGLVERDAGDLYRQA